MIERLDFLDIDIVDQAVTAKGIRCLNNDEKDLTFDSVTLYNSLAERHRRLLIPTLVLIPRLPLISLDVLQKHLI